MPHVDLLELPYFEGISMDELVSLVDAMDARPFKAGDELLGEGKAPPGLYIATRGQLRITKRSQDGGEDRVLAELKSPTLFGEIELFCNIPAVASVRAQTPVDTFLLTRPTFDRLFKARHGALLQFTFNVARVACHRLAVADGMLAEVLKGEDLVALRRAVFTRMGDADDSWMRTTGGFRRP